MSGHLNDWYGIYQFPSGRRAWAIGRVRSAIVEGEPWDALLTHCDASMAHETALRRTRRAYYKGRNQSVDPRLSALDPKIDRTLGAIARIAREAAESLDAEEGQEGPPLGDQAQRLLTELFPLGAGVITSATYVEQTGEIDSLLAELEGEWAPLLADLGATRYVNQLRRLNTQFRALLAETADATPTWKAVQALDREGQNNLYQVINMIMGRFPSSSPEDFSARATWLRPIWEQNEALAVYYRQRRRIIDIDPDTGEDVVDEDTTPDEDAPTPSE